MTETITVTFEANERGLADIREALYHKHQDLKARCRSVTGANASARLNERKDSVKSLKDSIEKMIEGDDVDEWDPVHPLHQLWDDLDFLANSEMGLTEAGYRREAAKLRNELGLVILDQHGVAPEPSERLHHDVPDYEENIQP